MHTWYMYTVQDDLLAGVIFGAFSCGKKLVDFILAILCHMPLSMLRLKQNGRFYIGDFFIETPIANINSLPIRSSCTVLLLLVYFIHVVQKEIDELISKISRLRKELPK